MNKLPWGTKHYEPIHTLLVTVIHSGHAPFNILFLMSFDDPKEMVSPVAWALRICILTVPLVFALGFVKPIRAKLSFLRWPLLILIVYVALCILYLFFLAPKL